MYFAYRGGQRWIIVNVGHVVLDSEGPADVDRILLQRQKEDYGDIQGVDDEKGEDGFVAQVLQFRTDFRLEIQNQLAVNVVKGKRQKRRFTFSLRSSSIG